MDHHAGANVIKLISPMLNAHHEGLIATVHQSTIYSYKKGTVMVWHLKTSSAVHDIWFYACVSYTFIMH